MTYRQEHPSRPRRALFAPLVVAALAPVAFASNQDAPEDRSAVQAPTPSERVQLLGLTDRIGALTHTGDTGLDVDIFNSPEARATFFSFSALQDSPNLRLNGTDEVGRPYTIPATSVNLGVFEDLVFPMARRFTEPTREQPTRINFSALQSGEMDIYALVGGTDEKTSQAASDEPETALNYRGEEVHPAMVPYFNDFESGERGMEWEHKSSVASIDAYTSFVGPLRRAEQVLHVRTKPNETYALQLDLYLIGFSDDVPDERTGMFTVLIDGAPVIEQTFGSFRNLSDDEEGQQADAPVDAPHNGQIIRGVETRFTATSEVAEIVIKGNTGPGFGTGSWGFDNVLVDEAPETNLGSFSSADFTGDAEFAAFNQTRERLTDRTLQGNPGVDKIRNPRPFNGTRGRPEPFDIQAFIQDLLDQLEDEQEMMDDEEMMDGEDMMDEEEMMEDMEDMMSDEEMMNDAMDDDGGEGNGDDSTTVEEVPAPGPASLLMIAGAAGLRRRR